MNPLRVGVIGLGEVAQVIHLPILQSLPELYEVAAVCDLSPTLLDVVGRRYGVERRYDDLEKLVRDQSLDCVLVLNSDEYHCDAVTGALRQSLHVLVEKPMCLSPREGPHDLPAAALADRRERGRRLVHDALGDVPQVLGGTYRLLCGLGSHDLSAMRELLGRPRGVAAARQWRDGQFVVALFEYDDHLAIYETGVDEQLRFDAHIEVYGETTSMRIQYDTPYVRHFPTVLMVEESDGDAYTRSVVRPHLKDPYTHELEAFHASVTAGVPVKTTPEDFVQDLELFTEIIRLAHAQKGAEPC